MSKRKNEDEIDEQVESKIEKLSESFDQNEIHNIPALPMEIILKIISNLDDHKDFQNCMMLSRDINELFFKTPEIMRKIAISINPDCESAHKFFISKGKFVRSIKIQSISSKYWIWILNRVPNLEELVLENSEAVACGSEFRCSCERFDGLNQCHIQWKLQAADHEPVDLTRLTTLKINGYALETLLKITKNIKNLKNFSYCGFYAAIELDLWNFLKLQDDLSDLTLYVSTFDHQGFPAGFKFKLKKLTLIIDRKFSVSSLKFLESQSELLEVLELKFPNENQVIYDRNDELSDIIFEKCKNLQKLVYPMPLKHSKVVQLPNLRNFENSFNNIDVGFFVYFFLNLNTLKCMEITNKLGIFKSLTTISIKQLDCIQWESLKFPNLKNLTIENFVRFRDEYYWQKFLENIENVENLSINHKSGYPVLHEDFIPMLIRNLCLLSNLRTFKFRHHHYGGDKYQMDSDENPSFDEEFYKILVDFNAKTLKVSKYIAQLCQYSFDVLMDYFRDFKVEIFCYHGNWPEFNSTSMKRVENFGDDEAGTSMTSLRF